MWYCVTRTVQPVSSNTQAPNIDKSCRNLVIRISVTRWLLEKSASTHNQRREYSAEAVAHVEQVHGARRVLTPDHDQVRVGRCQQVNHITEISHLTLGVPVQNMTSNQH